MSDKPIVYEQDGKVIYRASALGGCLRGLVAARQGYEATEVPEKLKEVFEAGHQTEASVTSVWYTLVDRQAEVVLDLTSRLQVRGHIDGFDEDTQLLIEIKSQSKDAFESWTPGKWTSDPLWRRYAWQVSVYMLAWKSMLGMLRVERETLRESVQVLEVPFHSLSEIRARVLLIESLATEDTFPPCEHEEWGCPFRYLHEGPELVDDLKVIGLTESYLVHKRAIEGHQKEMKETREKLEKRLGEKKKVVLPSGVLITRSDVTVEDHMVKGSSYTRLLITPPKEKNAARPE